MSKDEMIEDLFEENKRLKQRIARLEESPEQLHVDTPKGKLTASVGPSSHFPEIEVDLGEGHGEPTALIGWEPEAKKLLIRVWDKDHEDWRLCMNFETGEAYADPDVRLEPLNKLFPY